jgi:Galactose oxidase-like, Early set domain
MAVTFQDIPGWVSWENQGANIAVADLDKDGKPELIVLRIDHPTPGPNRGFYRVGRAVDAQGGVQDWGPWIEIPQWESGQNQGGGIAVADFGAAGLALIVFQIEHVEPGPNKGRYRVGRQLSADGTVIGGWSAWQQVPDWISWRDQGAAIATADLDGNGQPDLVVFHVDDFHTDNPRRPNKGFYRVGKNLGVDGGVQAWGDWLEVDWFSWFNQGAGLAIADLNGNGRPEILVFQIDDPRPGENAGWCRVGWDLDAAGVVQEGWGPWVRFDGWGSADNQGGGFALAPLGAGRPKAVVFQVNNPPGLNHGLFAVTDLVLDIDSAADRGVWRLLPYFSEVLPVHAALLHTGKVLFFAGSGNNAFRFQPAFLGNEAKQIFTSVVWDPTANVVTPGTFQHAPTLRRADNSVVDFLCCGHTFLADGHVLVAGGTGEYDKVIVNGMQQDADHGFAGIRDVLIFDPLAISWTPVAPMAHGRWYPTLIRLDNDSVIAASGLDEQAQGQTNSTLERNPDPAHAPWTITRDFNLPLYPHLFQVHDGRVFFTGGKMDTEGDSVPFLFDPINPTNSVVAGGLGDRGQCNQCASVILPPAQDQRIMILGGGPEDSEDPNAPRGRATRRVAVIDLTLPALTYQAKRELNHERMHVNAVLLPDRTVIAVGGGVTREASAQSKVVDPQGGREVFEAEIYDPAADTWTVTAPATIARLYHSVALLLPDGRVVSAGGNEDAPEDVHYGQGIVIRTQQAADILNASLIAPGLTTHSFNGTQRLVDLPIVATPPTTLNATIPNDRTIAPPGWYILFILDRDKVPSVARWVRLT